MRLKLDSQKMSPPTQQLPDLSTSTTTEDTTRVRDSSHALSWSPFTKTRPFCSEEGSEYENLSGRLSTTIHTSSRHDLSNEDHSSCMALENNLSTGDKTLKYKSGTSTASTSSSFESLSTIDEMASEKDPTENMSPTTNISNQISDQNIPPLNLSHFFERIKTCLTTSVFHPTPEDDDLLYMKFKNRYKGLAESNPKLMLLISFYMTYFCFFFINRETHGYTMFWCGFMVEMFFNIIGDHVCSKSNIRSIARLEAIGFFRLVVAAILRLIVQLYYGPRFPFWILQTFSLVISVNIFYFRKWFSIVNSSVTIIGTVLSIYLAYLKEYQTLMTDPFIYTEMKFKLLEVFAMQCVIFGISYVFSGIMDAQRDEGAVKQLEIMKQKVINASKTKFIGKSIVIPFDKSISGTLSHEARNPLQGIICSVQLMRHEVNEAEKSESAQFKVSQSIREMMDDIYNNSNLLLHIFSTSLQLSNLDLGGIRLKIQQFNLLEIVESMTSVFFRLAEEKGITIGSFFNFQHVPYCLFLGDQTRISQILMNIVSNAVKYTKSGHVLLTCDLCDEQDLHTFNIEKDSKYSYIKLTCQDTGRGMTEEQVKDLFKTPFYKVDKESLSSIGEAHPMFEEYYAKSLEKSSFQERNGFGLSITKSLLELMKGKIIVSSKVDVGSTITIIIPLEPVKSKSEQLESIYILQEDDINLESVKNDLNLKLNGKKAEFYIFEKGPLVKIILIPYLNFIFPHSVIHQVESYNKKIVPKKDTITIIVHGDLFDQKRFHITDYSPTIFIPIKCRGKTSDKKYISKPIRYRELLEVLFHYLKDTSPHRIVSPITVDQTQCKLSNTKSALVVDDNEINRKVLAKVRNSMQLLKYCKMMKLIGFDTVDIAENGLDCVEKYKLHEGTYDVIMMDLLMPVMSGKEACEMIKQLESNCLRKTPIIAVTANIWESKETLMNSGFETVLYKPILLNKLKEDVDTVLGRVK